MLGNHHNDEDNGIDETEKDHDIEKNSSQSEYSENE